MRQRSPFRVLMVAALSATLASAGCIDAAQDLVGDDELEAQGAQSATVLLAAENATADLSHLGLQIESVFAHNASVTPPDGYHEMDVTAETADVVDDGEGTQLQLASRTLPVGTYDQIVLRVGQTDVQAGGEASANESGQDNASAEGNASSANESDEGHGHDDHDHGGSDNASAEGNGSSADVVEGASPTGGFDIPINVTFEVTSDASTSVLLILDAGASTSGEDFEPAFDRVEIARDGEVVETIEDPDVGFRDAGRSTPTGTAPPVARMTIFDAAGDKVYQPDFQAESGAFANSLSSGLAVNGSIGFSGTESEAVADGAVVETYRWDFGDNETATGLTTNHSYPDPGSASGT